MKLKCKILLCQYEKLFLVPHRVTPKAQSTLSVLMHLDLDGSLKSLALLGLLGDSLGSHDSTTPVTLGLFGLLHVSLLDGGDELGELRVVLRADLGEGEDGSGLEKVISVDPSETLMHRFTYLLVDDRSESGLALDNGVWDTHLLAKSGEEDNELDWVDIVGDQDQRCFLVLDEADNVVETVLDGVRLLADIFLLLSLRDGGGLLGQTLLLLGLGLRAVLVEELESLGGGVAVKDNLELGNGRGNLQAHVQDLALALKADVLGPSHHAREVALGLDVLADTEVAGTLLDEGVLQDVSIFWET